MTGPDPAELRGVDLFEGLDDDGLAAWAAAAEVHRVAAGQVVVEQGEPPPGLQLLLEGTLRAVLVEGDRREPVGEHQAPTWIGAIPVLTGGVSGVRMEAVTDARLALVVPDDVVTLVMSQRPVFLRVMRQVRPVFSRIASMEQNRERLASLGTMAAGLAHELNNPAAAATRAAAELAEALDVLGSTIGHFVESGVERAEAHELVEMQRAALAQAAEAGVLGALDAADAEDAVADALDDLGVPDGWRLAEPLARAGVDAAWLERVQRLAGPATGAALEWVAASLTARGLAAEIADSTQRMSRLVGAVKTYAYMDRGELVEVDLHEGLETTLVILGHKLKHTAIRVERAYDRDLPPVTVHGAELNQVWTNLIDNAIDAMGEEGVLGVTTRRDGDCVEVHVADSGPGIPEDVLPRIFDPFFTTKDVGHGTGLGLDTARRIVADRHRGSLSVDSRPGRTVFTVRLPLA
ncbi:MAG TPA: ATP-binding protein [Miltoncostaeaceae bacterium]|nr:ATP-binding protein [Miltoncostaeaceae bacterium]